MEPEEVLEQVAEQEPVVETPAENVQEQVKTAPENVQEEPELVEEPVAEPEPLIIRTKGEWKKLSELAGKEFEVGKKYHISIKGKCEFMISDKKPSFGIETNEITFMKEEGIEVWIKTRI